MLRDTLVPALFPVLCVALAPNARAQQRLGVFDAPLVVTDEHHVMTQLGDLDGDGDTDAIGFWAETQRTGTSTQTGQLTAWLNDGLGKLVPTWELHPVLPWVYDTPARDGIGDIDGDGRDDYVIASHNTLVVYFSNGAAAPTEQTLALLTGDAKGVLVADVTHDGRPDVAVVSSSNLQLFQYDVGTGAMHFSSGYAASPTPDGLHAAELDGSPGLELFTTKGTSIELWSAAGGTLQPMGTSFALPSDMPMFAAGDVDGDGDDDIVNFGMLAYSLLRRTGPTSWLLETTHAGGPATQFADVDGDGDLDGVCCGGGGGGDVTYTFLNKSPSLFRVSLNDGTGTFAPAIEIPGLGSKHIAGVADLEGDGDMDLVGGRCVYYPTAPITAPVTPPLALPAQDARTVVDLDGDGDPDYRAGALDVRRNLGDGSHASWTNALPPAPAGGTWIGAGYQGDFDGDGDVDWLVGLEQNGTTSLELLANRGGGAFAHVLQSMPAAPLPLDTRNGFVADFDGDGDLDLAWRSGNPSYGTDVYANDGAGGLTYATTVDFRLDALGDFDGDHLPDFVVTNNSIASIYVAMNLGAMHFGTPTAIPVVYNGSGNGDHFSIGDLDSDGDDDVATIARGPQSFVRVAWSNGDGSFTITTEAGPFPGNAYPMQVAIADLDADGRNDMLVDMDPYARGSIDVFLRRTDNTGFKPAIRHAAFDAVHDAVPTAAFVVRDLDGDGDGDLVGPSVLWGRAFIPSTSGHRTQTGLSEPGSGGNVPTLGARGPFHASSPFELRLTGARPLTSGRLVVRDATPSAPFAGIGRAPAHGLALVVPFTTSAGDGNDGSGAWTLSSTAPSAYLGRTMRYEVTLDDVAGPSGSVRTNALELVFGP